MPMPQLAQEVEEGVVVTWFVELGDAVSEGQLLAEVQVQKVSVEVPSPVTGRVAQLLAGAGQVVRQGDPIAVIEESGGEQPSAPEAEPTAAAIGAAGDAVSQGPARPSPIASPAARRLARELSLDLTSIVGSGTGGRITERDVEAARQAAASPLSAVELTYAAGVEPLGPLRQSIAERLVSWQAATAQLTLVAEADVSDLATMLGESASKSGTAVGYLAAVVKTCATSLSRHVRLGARWSGQALLLPHQFDINVAVSLPDGLITPAVRAVEGKNIVTISAEIAELAERARSRVLTPSETEGGVFTVSNLGAHRIDAFTPLLNPPQVAILGIGQARRRAVVVDEVIVPRTMMTLSLTFDHRALDGVPAAAFLADLLGLLEQPGWLFDR